MSNFLAKIFLVIFFLKCHFIKMNNTTLIELLLRHNYDPYALPQIHDKPVEVNVSMFLANFRALQEKDLSFTVDCFVYLKWNEHRISLDFTDKNELTLPSSWINKLWTPQIYFKNGIGGNLHSEKFTTSYFILTPLNKNNGVKVFMASKITIQLLCDFDFKNYPHDKNYCDIEFMSLSERNNTLNLNWDLFKISKRVYNPDFLITNPIKSDCSTTYSSGTYSCLRGTILIDRFVKRYILRKYFPTFLIVCTSFLGFWVPTSSYPARACILTISLLSLITQQVQSQPVRSMSTISYNVWSNACIGLVFLSLIEFGLAIVWDEKNKINENLENKKLLKKNIFQKLFCYKYSPKCNIIDAYSRIIFPFCFIIFIIFYIFYISFRN